MIDHPWYLAIGLWFMLGDLGIHAGPTWKDATTAQKIGQVFGSVSRVVTGIVLVALSFR